MISIFTPTHSDKFLAENYQSILRQTYSDWEWIVLRNNNCPPLAFDDPRVKVHENPYLPGWVGPLKAAACGLCHGEILLELDHDDVLMPTALEEVAKAFLDPEVGFVYSNTIHLFEDAKTGVRCKIERFDARYGWRYRETEIEGIILDEHISFAPTPDSISRIWFAPNHLRAFRRSAYEQVGGYAKDMRILDDLDLMCRLYQVTKFKHIDKGLYIYRVHGENTWLRHNAEIQNNVYRIYDQYIDSLVDAWAKQEGLRRIELGGRMAARPGFETVDLKESDIICDLNGPWSFAEDSSVGVLRAFDVFEHLTDPIHVMKEVSRVLAPGGWLICQVPSTDGRGAFQDPTHVSWWNQNSFFYYTNANKAKYIDTPVRFQAVRLYTTDKNQEGVCWVAAHLINLKGGFRPAGLIEI